MAEEKKSGETKEKEFEDVDFGKEYKKERLFYRALSGYTYSLRDELRRLRKVPRVIKGKNLPSPRREGMKGRGTQRVLILSTPTLALPHQRGRDVHTIMD